MQKKLRIEVTPAAELSPEAMGEVHALCERAYEEELGPLFATFKDATHVLGYLDSRLVSHAMWVTRWLQPQGGPLLRTAYVEMVATEPQLQRRGYATQVMERLGQAIEGYHLGALDPAAPELYSQLGWIFWNGPLFIRSQEGWVPTPDERVMVLPLPDTPILDICMPLSVEWREGELW